MSNQKKRETSLVIPSHLTASVTREYEVISELAGYPKHEIPVYATDEELKAFEASGFLLRDSFFRGEQLETLRNILGEIEAEELARDEVKIKKAKSSFPGLFVRCLHDKHPFFIDLAAYPPLLSVAQAMMGPLLRLRNVSGRIVNATDSGGQDTVWHRHLRLNCTPAAPWELPPQSIDVLIYLDDISEDNGGLCVVPGSHLWTRTRMPDDLRAPIEGEQTFSLPAGSVVMIHSNLWHRGMPILQEAEKKRRLIIITYAPAWMRISKLGELSEGGAVQKRLDAISLTPEAEDHAQLAQLLGVPGEIG